MVASQCNLHFVFSMFDVVIDCGTPEAITGSTYTPASPTTLYGDSFTVSCNAPLFSITGESEDGDNTVRCDADGRWTFNTLSCQGKEMYSNQSLVSCIWNRSGLPKQVA